ncbi:MAG TPA: aminopeptidase P family protein [Longimicrobiales bacterium]|nr:aminopeptidase P family protein [Longimicrobiales bacterium]
MQRRSRPGLPGWWAFGVACATLAGANHVAAQVGSPAGAVPVERLAARREALMAAVGSGVVLVRSADERNLEGDYPQDSDFRQDNDFFYLTGIESAGAALVLVAREDAPDEAILYLPARSPAQEQWTGETLGPDDAAALTGIRDVRPTERFGDDVARLRADAASPLKKGGLVLGGAVPTGCLAREPERRCGDAFVGPALAAAGPAVRPLAPYTAMQRLVKDADELGRLRRAIDITAEAQQEAMKSAAPGMYEYEIEALIEYTFRRRGAERVGFPSIVGSGPNSTVLHYDKNRRQTRPGDLVVMDVGAEFGYYTADVTRTIPVSGRFTPRQRAVYELVLAAQQAAIDAVRPGITVQALDEIARRYIRDHSSGLCGESPCDRYFIHGLSHWLGMDVHDVGAYDRPLAPGMVLTVEPGVYLPREGLGVRIEDDVLVTAEGGEVLSAGAPRSVADVERLMASGARARAAGTR